MLVLNILMRWNKKEITHEHHCEYFKKIELQLFVINWIFRRWFYLQ